MQFRGIVHELVEAARHEIGELHLSHGAQAVNGGANGVADDGRFGKGRFPDALFAKFVDQTFGDAKGAAIDADVLAEQKHVLVARHFLAQPLSDRFNVSDGRHGGQLSVFSYPLSMGW